jgi:nitroimidazol reductase NimA-like FMN-containing flavoprotein (pyridoxamine 5'-phosphate oxidase superfamily)
MLYAVTLTDRTKLRRLPDRGAHTDEAVHAILDAGFLAHIGFVTDGQPFVIPTLYGREGNTIYLHGSAASRMMRQLETGIPVCLTVTLVDGLVLARSAFHHSMNYRSVVAFGTARKIEDQEEKSHALRVISDHLIKGRWEEAREPAPQELKGTTVLRFEIDEASAKVRSGPPKDDKEDYELPVWAGVLPLRMTQDAPVPDGEQKSEVPSYVRDYASRRLR